MSTGYAIVQYNPMPERHEFVNVGVLILDEHVGLKSVKFSDDFKRAKRMFDDINVSFLKLAVNDFSERLKFELAREKLDVSSAFWRVGAVSNFRVTKVLPMIENGSYSEIDRLFEELVETPTHKTPRKRVDVQLTSALRQEGVLGILDKRPDAVHIEKYNIDVKASYGFQNGNYNLIDSARFDEPDKAIAEAGRRVLEGKAISEMLGKKLIVVGDFGGTSLEFYNAISADFEKASTNLFRLDDISSLAHYIKDSVH